MGNDVSKEIKNIVDVLEVNGKSSMTPGNKTAQSGHIDPRSPSEGIIRTPIEVRKNPEHLEKTGLLRRRWKSEPEITSVKMDCTEKHSYLLLCNDPRSPTLGIARTPIQVPFNEVKCEKMYGDETTHNNILPNINMVVDVPDCRSPSLGISRTPIQVATHDKSDAIMDLSIVQSVVDIKLDNKLPTTLGSPWHTPISKRISSPSFVYTDEDIVDIKGKKDVKQYDQNSDHEKENEATLKRKLKFTPESVKSGGKMRPPLGSRCNFQDSPSQFLKKMQVQKVDEELGYVNENASNNGVTKSVKKIQSVIEWDNKDSTLVM